MLSQKIVLMIGALVLLALGANEGEADDKMIEVDLELVLAADRSASMSRLLLIKQRNGFAAAFRDQRLHRAISSGPVGKIAVVYFDWSGAEDQRVTVPWTVLETSQDMANFADAIDGIVIERPNGETSIGGAILFAHSLLDSNQYVAQRRVIDISANGKDSEGPPIHEALAALQSPGATVNGLVLPEKRGGRRDPSLTDYFWHEVIGGPGAFAITVDPDRSFTGAIRRKLVLEVAWQQ